MKSWPLLALVACVSTASVGEGETVGGLIDTPGTDVSGFQMTLEWALTHEAPGDDAFIQTPMFIDGSSDRYELVLPESVPAEALNRIDGSSFSVGVAWVIAYPLDYVVPTGRRLGFDGLSESAASNAIGRSYEYVLIYRSGTDSEFPRTDSSLAAGAWMLNFPEGFGCGRVATGAFPNDYFEPVSCASVPVRFGSLSLEVPDWR